MWITSLYIQCLNSKADLARITVVFHKHKIAHGKCVVFTHICCRKTPTLLENHLNVCFFFLRKIEDTQMILQQSECLSATNICGQNTLLPCNFIFMQHNSHSDMVESLNLKSLNLKTCKLINIRLDLSHDMTKPTK